MPPRIKSSGERPNIESVKSIYRYLTTVRQYELLKPDFFSVTYRSEHADDRYTPVEATRRIARHLRERGFRAVPHLTAVGKNADTPLIAADAYWSDAMHDILVLRGDEPKAGSENTLVYHNALALMQTLVARRTEKGGKYGNIFIAANPENTGIGDIKYLNAKLITSQRHAGPAAAITQVCLDETQFGEFLQRSFATGILPTEIVAGILPIHSTIQRIKHFTHTIGVNFPDALERELMTGDLNGYADRAAHFLERQITGRQAAKITKFHIYSANNPGSAAANNPGSATVLATMLDDKAAPEIARYRQRANRLAAPR